MKYITLSEHVAHSDIERFWLSVDKPADECWSWTGQFATNGYGRFRANGTILTAHRVSYFIFHGDIPHGLGVDHLCRNRACVNPEHLELVTQKVNVNRGLLGDLNPYRSVCPKGHAIEGYNAMPTMNGNPRCRSCNRDYMREYKRAHYVPVAQR